MADKTIDRLIDGLQGKQVHSLNTSQLVTYLERARSGDPVIDDEFPGVRYNEDGKELIVQTRAQLPEAEARGFTRPSPPQGPVQFPRYLARNGQGIVSHNSYEDADLREQGYLPPEKHPESFTRPDMNVGIWFSNGWREYFENPDLDAEEARAANKYLEHTYSVVGVARSPEEWRRYAFLGEVEPDPTGIRFMRYA
jgi:hypothetical protein